MEDDYINKTQKAQGRRKAAMNVNALKTNSVVTIQAFRSPGSDRQSTQPGFLCFIYVIVLHARVIKLFSFVLLKLLVQYYQRLEYNLTFVKGKTSKTLSPPGSCSALSVGSIPYGKWVFPGFPSLHRSMPVPSSITSTLTTDTI